MIPFEIEKISVDHVWMKSCTTALGGSITVIDEDRTTADKEVFKKIKVPMAVARAFIKRHKISRYMTPILTAMTVYDDHVVALERHLLENLENSNEGLYGQPDNWTSHSEINLDSMLMPLTFSDDWYIDGTFVYQLRNRDVAQYEPLTSNHRFRSIEVNAIKLANIHDNELFHAEDRTCLQYVSLNGESAITSPIWKLLDNVGTKQLNHANEDGDEISTGPSYQFDEVNDRLIVNLGFALKAGRELSQLFGYDTIEPLQLDKLMIQLQTVNLPSIPSAVKQTFDIGIPFTHMIAWLIGMCNRANTLDSYIVMRSLLKHLTTKGVYRKGAFDPSAVYRDDMSADNVEQLSVTQAAENTKSEHHSTKFNAESLGGLAGGLYGAE